MKIPCIMRKNGAIWTPIMCNNYNYLLTMRIIYDFIFRTPLREKINIHFLYTLAWWWNSSLKSLWIVTFIPWEIPKMDTLLTPDNFFTFIYVKNISVVVFGDTCNITAVYFHDDQHEEWERCRIAIMWTWVCFRSVAFAGPHSLRKANECCIVVQVRRWFSSGYVFAHLKEAQIPRLFI